MASPTAWAALEGRLRMGVRRRLEALVDGLRTEAEDLRRRAAAADPDTTRTALLRLRRRYLQVETLVDFYGDAVNTRTNAPMADLLGGFDVLAVESMRAVLEPLGLGTPPALVYVDKGLGAAILRAGVRLWDHGHLSPAAAIKLTRHNVSFPTALLHETGHQVCALTGYDTDLARALQAELEGPSVRAHPGLARLWSSWASELAGDVHAFLHAGAAPVFALANVVDGDTRQVFRIRPGDPHPFAWIRVMVNVEMCRRFFGTGAWDDLAAVWVHRHAPDPGFESGRFALASVPLLGRIVDVCVLRPMPSLHGQCLADLLDPARVRPPALHAFEREAGDTLVTSGYLRRREPIRILALLAGEVAEGSRPDARDRLLEWVRSVGRDAAATAAGDRPAPSFITRSGHPA